MYSQKIVSARMADTERLTGTGLVEHSIGEIEERLAELQKLEGPDGSPPNIASLPPHLQTFIINEQRMCRISFHYWATRYCFFVSDKRRVERFDPWPSQKYFLRRVAEEEERQWNAWLARDSVEEFRYKGRFIFLKSRQVGATRVGNILGAHLTLTFPNTNFLIASDTPEKGVDLWRFWDGIYKALPWFLAPGRESRVKGEEHHFAGIGSTLVVGAGNQKGSFQGITLDGFHLTECSRWNPDVLDLIDKDIFWSFESSRKLYSLGIIESTTEEGVGGWYEEQWDVSAKGKSLFLPTFLGWFLCPDKFRLDDPSVTLTDATLAIGKRVEERFPDVRITAEQLKWYQTRRAEMEAKGKLGEFFSQVPTFPEEAFQYGQRSIFSYDTLEAIKSKVKKPLAVKRLVDGVWEEASWDGDPKTADGLLLVWKAPRAGRVYAIGVDGAHGRKGGDSSAIEVVAAPVGTIPAEQVAEWSSRDSGLSELLQVVLLLGEMYKDSVTGRPAMVAPESNPGSPSQFITLQLIEAGYPNIYVHRRAAKVRGQQLKEEMGWQTNEATRTPLILRGKDGLENGNLVVYSNRVLDEMATFIKDWTQSGLKVRYTHADGKHDDCLVALFIAYWVATDEVALVEAEEAARGHMVTKKKAAPIPDQLEMIAIPDEPGEGWNVNGVGGKYPWTANII